MSVLLSPRTARPVKQTLDPPGASRAQTAALEGECPHEPPSAQLSTLKWAAFNAVSFERRTSNAERRSEKSAHSAAAARGDTRPPNHVNHVDRVVYASAQREILSKNETMEHGKMPVPHPFTRHVVAGEDTRARLSTPPFTINARSSHIPVTNRFFWGEVH